MMDSSRRSLFKKALLLISTSIVTPSLAKAVSLNLRYGKNKPKYYKFFLSNFYKWYCKTNFNFEDSFTKEDKKFLTYCFNNMNELEDTRGDNIYPPKFMLSPRIEHGVADYSRIYLSCSNRGETFKGLLQKSLLSHGIKQSLLELKDVYGLGFDFKNKIVKVFLEKHRKPSFEVDKHKLANYSIKEILYKNSKLADERELGFVLPPFSPEVLHRSLTTTQAVTVAKNKKGELKFYWDTRYGSTHIMPYTEKFAEPFIKSFALAAYKFSETSRSEQKLYYP